MKGISFYFHEAITDIWINKGRSFLTSLGIIIGVYSVIMLLSLGQGLKVYIEQQFESLGTNLIFVVPGKLEGVKSSQSMIGGPKFTENDYRKLQSGLSEARVVPVILKSVVATSRKDQTTALLSGSTQDLSLVYNMQLQQGRFFSKSEELSGRKVIVLGSEVAEDLFATSPVGQTLDINDLKFKIVGVLQPKGGGGLGDSSFDNHLYAPYKALYLLSNERDFYSFYIKTNSSEEIDLVQAKAERILLKNHEEEDFSLSTQDELLTTISDIFTMINFVLVGIAAISLLVGGIGITNIMYVTVTERTREIGIRRAIGAQENNILYQFLSLSLILTFMGGLIGIVLAYLTTLAVYQFFPATITLEAVLIAFAVCAVIGTTFGVFPARKAAKLSPVEAIRYE